VGLGTVVRRALQRVLRLALIACCGLTLLLAGRSQAADIKENSPAWDDLMATSLGDDVVGAFQWLRVLQGSDRPELAQALEKMLVWRFLQRAQGEPAGVPPTIAQALQLASSLPALEAFAPQLGEVLAKQLKPQWLSEPVPWPAEWKSDAAGARAAAPGLWWRDSAGEPGSTNHSNPRNSLALVFDLLNPGPLPLALHSLQISAPGLPGGFVCLRPAQQPLALLAPGSSTRLHCISNIMATPGDPRYALALASFSAGSRAALLLRASAPGDAKPVRDFAQFMQRQGVGPAAETAAFNTRNRDCTLRGTCGAVAVRAESVPAPAAPRARMGPAARVWLMVLSAFWLYCGLARWLGNAVARNGALVLATIGLYKLFSDLGSGVGSLVTRDTSALAGIAVVVGVLGSLLWGWIASRVMFWLYAWLFGDGGIITWVYRDLRRDLGGDLGRGRRPRRQR
jgi:hypothetical protein